MYFRISQERLVAVVIGAPRRVRRCYRRWVCPRSALPTPLQFAEGHRRCCPAKRRRRRCCLQSVAAVAACRLMLTGLQSTPQFLSAERHRCCCLPSAADAAACRAPSSPPLADRCRDVGCRELPLSLLAVERRRRLCLCSRVVVAPSILLHKVTLRCCVCA
eukprot:6187900-Pleurochrysis_carterae.AAC.1